jgi:hypothetical protein
MQRESLLPTECRVTVCSLVNIQCKKISKIQRTKHTQLTKRHAIFRQSSLVHVLKYFSVPFTLILFSVWDFLEVTTSGYEICQDNVYLALLEETDGFSTAIACVCRHDGFTVILVDPQTNCGQGFGLF